VNSLEIEARKLGLTKMYTEASITAKPFFEHHGYQVTQPQTVVRRNVKLVNYKMTKTL
jgi:putative acetyltransferase